MVSRSSTTRRAGMGTWASSGYVAKHDCGFRELNSSVIEVVKSSGIKLIKLIVLLYDKLCSE